MAVKDGIGWRGIVTVERRDAATGALIERKEYHNLVTSYALAYIAQVITGGVQASSSGALALPAKMELGTGSGTPQVSDTALWTPSVATLQALSVSQQYLNTIAQFGATWVTGSAAQGSASVPNTWTEAGLFDANGNMWAHAPINVSVYASEYLTVQWNINFIPS